jgi:hypothetical protein
LLIQAVRLQGTASEGDEIGIAFDASHHCTASSGKARENTGSTTQLNDMHPGFYMQFDRPAKAVQTLLVLQHLKMVVQRNKLP